MSVHRFSVNVAARQERAFDLWTDLDRLPEWVEGVTRVTDVTGPSDRAGTRYTVWFGSMRSPTEILEAVRPRMLRTRFGNWLLRGESVVTFESDGSGTRVTQEFRTEGLIPAIAARLFATGSYRGSFRGELNTFARLAERVADPDAINSAG
jgi:polyketide cyclase/dehydrase/lipid transport protein